MKKPILSFNKFSSIHLFYNSKRKQPGELNKWSDVEEYNWISN